MPKDPKPVTVKQLDEVIDSLERSISSGRVASDQPPLSQYQKEVAGAARNECKHFRDILLGKEHDEERKGK